MSTEIHPVEATLKTCRSMDRRTKGIQTDTISLEESFVMAILYHRQQKIIYAWYTILVPDFNKISIFF